MSGKTKQPFYIAFGAIVLFAVSGAAFAAEPSKAKKTVTSTSDATTPAIDQVDANNPITVNAITGAAAKSGIVKCLTRVNQVTNFITANSESGAYLFINKDRPDESFISSSLEVQNGKILTYASASFAPVGAGGCGGVYDTITYWTDSCEIVGSKGFGKLKKAGFVQRNIQILEGAGTIRIFLVPAGTGCLSIKKEVIF